MGQLNQELFIGILIKRAAALSTRRSFCIIINLRQAKA